MIGTPRSTRGQRVCNNVQSYTLPTPIKKSHSASKQPPLREDALHRGSHLCGGLGHCDPRCLQRCNLVSGSALAARNNGASVPHAPAGHRRVDRATGLASLVSSMYVCPHTAYVLPPPLATPSSPTFPAAR
jgi:hypothetical protein